MGRGAPPRICYCVGLLWREGSWSSRGCGGHPCGAQEPVFPYSTPLGLLFILKLRVPVRMEVESEI